MMAGVALWVLAGWAVHLFGKVWDRRRVVVERGSPVWHRRAAVDSALLVRLVAQNERERR